MANPLMPDTNSPSVNPLMPQQESSIPNNAAPSLMIGSDGKMYNVPASSYQVAIKNGWRIAAPEEEKQLEERKAAKVEKENKIVAAEQKLEEEPFRTGVGQFLDEASLGVKPYYEKKNRTPEENEINTAAQKRYVEANPIKSYAAKGLGFLAPLAIPGVGEVGELAEGVVRGGKVAAELASKAVAETGEKAFATEAAGQIARQAVRQEAETSLARKIAGTAANYATQGAIYSTPLAATQLAYGDPEQAAETMLWGIGLSGILGAGAGTIGAAGRGAVSLTDRLGSKLLEKDASGLSLGDTMAKRLFQMPDKTATKLKDRGQFDGVLNTAFDEGLHKSALTDDFAGDVRNMKTDAGGKIGDIRDLSEELRSSNPEEYNKFAPSGNSIAAEFQKAIFEKNTELTNATRTSKSSLKTVNDIIGDLNDAGIEPSFAKTREVFEDIIKNKGTYERNSPQAKIYETFYQVYTTAEKKGMQDMFSAGEMPEKYPEYLKQLQRFTTASSLEKGINDFKGKGKLPSNIFGGFKGLGDIYLLLTHPAAEVGKLGVEYAYKAFKENKFGLLGKGVGYLRKVANDPAMVNNLGGFMAKAGVEGLQEHLGSIPSYLSGSKLVARSVADANPYQHLIGDTTGLSKDQQYAKLTAAITRASVDTNTTAQRVGNIASTFTGTSVDLASLVAAKKLGALSYLQSQIPKNPNPPKAFQTDDWKPTRQQQVDFLEKVKVVNNPMIVWQKYQDNTISTLDRETLKAVYPKIYSEMVNAVMTQAFDPRNKPLNYNDRMKLSQFTGIPLDSSLKNIAAVQQAVSTPTPQQASPGGKQKAPRASRAPKFNNAPSLMSESDSRLYGHKRR